VFAKALFSYTTTLKINRENTVFSYQRLGGWLLYTRHVSIACSSILAVEAGDAPDAHRAGLLDEHSRRFTLYLHGKSPATFEATSETLRDMIVHGYRLLLKVSEQRSGQDGALQCVGDGNEDDAATQTFDLFSPSYSHRVSPSWGSPVEREGRA
jgi:hypothetical protein